MKSKTSYSKNNRIVLPRCYQSIATKLAHQGHQGITKTKALMRSKIFFPGMDTLIEEELRYCKPCQSVDKKVRRAHVTPTPLPNKTWQTINIDYLGPLPDGKYAVAMIDQRSRYPIVTFTTSTSAKNLIQILTTDTFTQFGYPENVVSDNGPPFQSHELRQYFKQNAINHRRITPLWPQANGEIERFMLPLTKVICTAHSERKPYKQEFQKFLMAYRVTPH